MRKAIRICLLVLALGQIENMYSQDPNFSQFYFKESYYNPAFTGINPGFRGTVTQRQFWTNTPGNNATTHLEIDFYDVQFLNGGLGLVATSYAKGEGYLRNDIVGLQYAKRIGISHNLVFQVGAKAAYVMRKADYSKLIFSDELDPRFGRVYQTEFVAPPDDHKHYFDYSAGAVARFNILKGPNKVIMTNNLGIAFHHLTQPNEAWYANRIAQLPMKVNIHGYSVIKVSRNNFYNSYFLLAPGAIFEKQTLAKNYFAHDESGMKTLAGGVNAIIPAKLSFISQLYTGVWVRKQYYKKLALEDVAATLKSKQFDAVIFMLGYIKYDRRGKQLYRFAYSYDLTISSAAITTGGTHEVTLAFEIHNLALPRKGRNWGYVHNPADRFFHLNQGPTGK